MIRILLIAVVLILWGSLYPWQFAAIHLDARAISLFLHSWPSSIGARNFSDIFINVLLYVPVGVFGFFALERRGHRRIAWVAPLVLAFVLSSAIEIIVSFRQACVTPVSPPC